MPGLQSAGSEQHLWFVNSRPGQPDSLALFHHATDLGGPYARELWPLSIAPEALAAWGATLWLVYPETSTGREVLSVQAVFNPALAVYRPEPPDRLSPAGTLPGGGRVAGFAATSQGPVALIVPAVRTATRVTASTAAAATGPGLPALFRLQADRWVPIPLPDGFRGAPGSMLLVDGPQGGRIRILEPDDIEKDAAVLHMLQDDGSWTRNVLDVDSRRAVSATLVQGNSLMAMAGEDDAAGPASIKLAYVRDSGAFELCTLRAPGGPWTLNAYGNGAALLWQTDSHVWMRRIDGISGRAGEPVELVDQPISASRVWQVGLTFAVAVLGLLCLMLLRPNLQVGQSLPKGMHVATLGNRLGGAATDLFPAAVLALLIVRGSPIDLMALPMFTLDFADARPYLLMVAIATGHSLLTELIARRSIGKMLAGTRMVKLDGTHIAVSQVLVRSLLKMLVLLVPPLIVVMFLNPNRQGIQDIAARCLVVQEGDEDEPAEEGGESP